MPNTPTLHCVFCEEPLQWTEPAVQDHDGWLCTKCHANFSKVEWWQEVQGLSKEDAEGCLEDLPSLQPPEVWVRPYLEDWCWGQYDALHEVLMAIPLSDLNTPEQHQVAHRITMRQAFTNWNEGQLSSQGYEQGRKSEKFIVRTYNRYPEVYADTWAKYLEEDPPMPEPE